MNARQDAGLYEQYVGVDIGSESSSVAVLYSSQTKGAEAFNIEPTPHDLQALQHRLLSTGCAAERTRVGMEATGNYWIRLAASLHQAGFAVSVINPAQAHHVAQALLQRPRPMPSMGKPWPNSPFGFSPHPGIQHPKAMRNSSSA